ncbi:MAG TPA: hypothetical protein P5184_10450, partial [Bacteroidales bacterium]|nr:hypothetical protein [Bacteroidales bacterium]
NSDSQVEVKIQNMMLLSEALEKLVKEITVRMPLKAVDHQLTELFSKLLKKMKGKCSVKFVVFDTDENLSIEMPSGKFHVPCSEFLHGIRDIPEISYKLS